MPDASTAPAASVAGASPALLAKGALRRLAADRIEPTPENYARAYRLEAGEGKGAGILPGPAQRLIERVAARAFEADASHAGSEFVMAMAEGRWDLAERTLEGAPAQAGDALARLIERIVRGVERGGSVWTIARRKAGVQRVLDSSRGDARRLQQRMSQLITIWDGDVQADAAVDAESAAEPRPSDGSGEFDAGSGAGAGAGAVAGAVAGAGAVEVAARARRDAAASSSSASASASASASESSATARSPAWNRVIGALCGPLRLALPITNVASPEGGASQQLAAALETLEARLDAEGATPDLADAAEQVGFEIGRVVQHRHHLLDQLGKLTLELTASLADLSENDSWVRGQCDAMRLKIEEGLTVRGARAVGDLLHVTRKRHAGLRAERERARDALKALINRMLAEVGELGSRTGTFHESVGRYAAVIEEADSLESLTGVVREMVEESRTVQSLVRSAQQRLNDEHAKATDLSQRVIELEGEMKRLSDEVSTDQLTQIANRRGLMQAFKVERARMERTGRPLSVGLIDIDDFKRVNDELGHGVGDEALKSLASLVSKNLRPGDCVARYGGEEFVVLLPETSGEDAQIVLTRLQRALTGGLFMHKEKQVFITFSAGVTVHRLEDEIETSVERADQALYEAKRMGKNRTCIV
ncbi:MAG: GGDEF domain-containing protein [Caldimonas sp.]